MPLLRNPKHEEFVRGMLDGLSATQAYIKAGYSKTGADGAASRLLGNVSVRERLKELNETVTQATVQLAIANRNDRVAAQNERWHLMRQVIAERALDARMRAKQVAEKAAKENKPAPAAIPGDFTGLLARTAKSIGSGKAATVIVEYEVDTGLLRELRAHEEHASKELGQWTEKTDSTVRFPALKDATEDEIRAMLADLGDQEGVNPGPAPGAGAKATPA